MPQVCEDAAELACRAAALVSTAAGQAIAAEGRFTMALAGGETPRALYRQLVSAPLDWSRIHLFWGDERGVPPTHPQSNYRMVSEELLSRVPLPEENVHRIPAEKPLEEAAAAYEEELRRFFQGWPRFHLALLGLGVDGHTASLFPGSPALQVEDRAVVAVAIPALERWPAVGQRPALVLAPGRVSLTAAALNRSRQILFLVSGAQKAAALAAVLEGPPASHQFPAQLIRPESGAITWLVDAAAASLLEKTRA